MSRPPVNPDKTVAGIAVDPQTLERVIPESKRPDGTVRKQIKIRPGFTPQEDVRRFRGTRQVQMDANTIPKGHIIGWAPPPQAAPTSDAKPISKAAKKNAKRREKKQDAKKDEVPDNWDDDEADDAKPEQKAPSTKEPKPTTQSSPANDASGGAEELATKLGKLEVK
ncbi:hypothetical protein C0991_006053 [Blastosporella zonata]|nr:hypothetical protein C0991_006053 [Blastosporella zonata]